MLTLPLSLKFQATTLNYNTWFCLFLSLVCIPFYTSAQQSASLEEQRKIISYQIEMTSKILSETEKNKSATIDKYQVIQEQITNRKKLLLTINSEIDYAQNNLTENEAIITLLEDDIAKLKNDYALMLKSAYRQKLLQNDWMHLFSSSSLTEAILRYRYSKQFQEYALQKQQQIKQSLLTFQQKSTMIDSMIDHKQKLLGEEKQQSSKLQTELEEKDAVLATLNLNESRLRTELRKQKDEATRLNKIIEDIIASELSVKESSINTSPNTPNATADFDNLSAHFEKNKGKFPWPVKQGFITTRFGKQNHPTLNNVTIQNNGIDIRTNGGANIKSLFQGTVTNKLSPPGYGNMVIIRHGSYRIVYARMNEIYVGVGDEVNAGQTIGNLSNDHLKSELQLQIWKNNTKLNPEQWLRRL